MDKSDSKLKITALQQAAASCTGVIITSLCVTPLDVIKTRLQVQQQLVEIVPKLQKQTYHFNGSSDAFLKIVKYEGIATLWSGLGPTLISIVPSTVVYFVSYEQMRLKLKDYYNKNSTAKLPEQPYWIPLLSGSIARTFSTTAISPLELIRTKMQSQNISYMEIEKALRSLIHENGIKGLWKGITASLLRDVPFSAIYWANYEAIKKAFGSEVPTFSSSFIGGAISGGIAATLTVPFDVVKTHQQTELGNMRENARQSKTTWTILKQIYRLYGIQGLFAGLTPRLMRAVPACAIMIATFEKGKIFFNNVANSTFS